MSKVVDNYKLIEEIGSGQYGKVYRGEHIKTGDNYAIKCISLDKYRRVPKLDEFTKNEISVLSKLVHKNIVRFYEKLNTANNIYMIYEYCNGGTLEELIYKNNNISMDTILDYFNQLIEGFRAIARENILHRDIKPSNILIHNGSIIKIADFGFCKSLFGELDMTRTMVGSPIYMAPELLKGMQYSQKADVWSLGVLLYEMIFKCCPYEEKNIPSLINLIEKQELRFHKSIPDNIKRILIGMLTKDPIKRWTWNELFIYYDQYMNTHTTTINTNITNNTIHTNTINSTINMINNNTSTIQYKHTDAPNIPPYIQQLRDNSTYRDIYSIIDSNTQYSGIEYSIMRERSKLVNMIYSMTKIDKYGLIDSVRIQEIHICILKRCRHISLNMKILLNDGVYDSVFNDVDNIRYIIQKDIDTFNTVYKRFIDSCEKHIVRSTDSSDRYNKMVYQIDKIYEYDDVYYRYILLDTVKHLFDSIRSIDHHNSYGLIRHYQMINYILDCILIDDINKILIDIWTKPVDQPYYHIIDRLSSNDLYTIIYHKYNHILSSSYI